MLSIFAALLAAAPPDGPAAPPVTGRTAWIVATIEHSEFCPAGNVRLDIRTGRYSLVRRASRRVCRDGKLERPESRGVLNSKRLAAIRGAALRVIAEGFESPPCRAGSPPENIIISNGGTPTLILSIGFETASAIDDQSCWSDSATALHDLLDETFAPEPR